jgi:solute carrier family 25 uncoupling protein 8/9
MVFASMRIGLYDPVLRLVAGDSGEVGLGRRILAGLLTGAIGICVASPTDVVKIKLQAQMTSGTSIYKNSTDCYRKIVAEEGVVGLWRGIGPNVMRNAVINSAELATYS